MRVLGYDVTLPPIRITLICSLNSYQRDLNCKDIPFADVSSVQHFYFSITLERVQGILK